MKDEKEGFKMGAHKAFLFAKSMLKADIIIVSNTSENILEEMYLIQASNIEEASFQENFHYKDLQALSLVYILRFLRHPHPYVQAFFLLLIHLLLSL